MAQLRAKCGAIILIDDGDREWLSRWRWSLTNSGYPHASSGLIHRLITGAKKGEYVDHVNGDKLDNRRANLRLATQQQNQRNRRRAKSKTSSQFKGVFWDKDKRKWRVRIVSRQSGRLLHLGYFEDEMVAAKVYDDAARSQYGEFARTNFATEQT